jgi:hypothetical protein
VIRRLLQLIRLRSPRKAAYGAGNLPLYMEGNGGDHMIRSYNDWVHADSFKDNLRNFIRENRYLKVSDFFVWCKLNNIDPL